MPVGLGAIDAQGVYLFGESDVESLASDLLNRLGESVSDQFVIDRVRLAALELAILGAPVYVASSTSARDTHWDAVLAFAGATPATATERLALQNAGATTIRTDTGQVERYYAGLTDGGSNPGGRYTPGWYSGRLAFKQTFSTLSTVDLVGLFAASPGANWEVILDISASSTSSDVLAQALDAAVPLTTAASYSWAKSQQTASTNTPTGSASATSMNIGRVDGTAGGFIRLLVSHMNAARRTFLTGSGADGTYKYELGGSVLGAVAHDGLRVFTGSAATLTGTAYGYIVEE